MSHRPSGRPGQDLRGAGARDVLAAARDEALARVPDEEEPLTLLAEASRALLALPDAASVVPSLLALTRRLFRADRCAVWRLRPNVWELVGEVGRPEADPA